MNSPPSNNSRKSVSNKPRQPEIVEDVELFIDDQQDGNKQLDLNNIKEEVFLKLLVLGDLGVGKSTLIKRYTGEENNDREGEMYRVSVGTSFSVKRVELDGKSVFIQLWDVPGHERFGGMTKTYYKYAHGALIVFDLSRPETFEAALSWLSDVTEKLFDERQQHESQQQRQQQQQQQQGAAASGRTQKADSSSKNSKPDENPTSDLMPVILLANKCDLPDLKVPRNKYSTYVTENGLLSWYETSAHDPSCGVALAVRRLVEFVMENDPSLKIARENAMIWKKK